MSVASTYCCWVKITPKDQESAALAGVALPLPRPVALTELMHQVSDQLQPDIVVREPDRPPRAAAMQCTAWWSLDSWYGGSERENTDLAPVFGDREAAVAWIKSDPGKLWLQGAAHFFLIFFHQTDVGGPWA